MGKSSRKIKKMPDYKSAVDRAAESLDRKAHDSRSSEEKPVQEQDHFKYRLAGSVSLVTFMVYLAALPNEFVFWDDGWYIFDNPHIRSFDLTFLKWAFFDFYAGNWHPLTWISHALDYAVWGLNPLGHHLTNNILHAANTFLVVLLVVRLIETAQGKQLPSGQAVESSSGSTQLLNYSTPQLLHRAALKHLTASSPLAIVPILYYSSACIIKLRRSRNCARSSIFCAHQAGRLFLQTDASI